MEKKEKHKTNNVALFLTEYSLLLYLLLEKNWKKTYFVWLNTRIEKNITDNMKICGANRMYGNRVDAIKIESSKNICLRIYAKVLRLIFVACIRIIRRCMFFKKNTCVYGQDHASLAKYFYDYQFIVIEDGVANYETEEKTIEWCKKYNKKLCVKIIPFGFSDCINKVYLTGRKVIADEKIRKKAIVFNMEECWESKTDLEKKEILFIFGYDIEKINSLVYSGKDTFLLTQNFSDLYCTNEEQVLIYRLILQGNDLSKVIIKPHPNDHIEYEKIFPECVVLRDKFPFELLYLTKAPVAKIITINSTSIYGLWSDDVIEKHEDIAKRILYMKNDEGNNG